MKPNYRIVKIDTTEYWRKDIREKAGRIYEVCIYDENVGVHLCELTPSYLLFVMGPTWETNPENDEESETLFNDIMKGMADSEPDYFLHCRDVDKMDSESYDLTDEKWEEYLEDADGDEEEANRKIREDISEYLHKNERGI